MLLTTVPGIITLDIARKAGATRVINHRVNKGLGAAVRTGITEAKKDGADIIVKFDADQQHDPGDVYSIIGPVLDDDADVVYGDRFEKIEYKMSLVRRMGNIVFTRLMRWLPGWDLKASWINPIFLGIMCLVSWKTSKPIVHVNVIMGLLLFGLQTLFFGMLAHLIVEMGKKR